MKKIIFLILIIFLVLPVLVFAQDATDSSVSEKIKERLEKTAEQGLTTIKEELTSQTTMPQKKAYVGLVKSITNDLITLEYKSQTYLVYTDVKTSAKQNDHLLALGFFYPDKDQFHAKKILALKEPQPPLQRQLISGEIQEIDGNKITVDNKTLVITSKTELLVESVENPTINNLELKDQLFAIITLDKNGDIDQIKNLLIIPGKNNPAGMSPTNATESALPATNSATIE